MSTHLDVTGLPMDKAGILAGVRKPLCAAYNKVRGNKAQSELLRATLETVLARLPEAGEEPAEVKLPRVHIGPTRKELAEMDVEGTEAVRKAIADAKVALKVAAAEEEALAENIARDEAAALRAAELEQAATAGAKRKEELAAIKVGVKKAKEAKEDEPVVGSEFSAEADAKA